MLESKLCRPYIVLQFPMTLKYFNVFSQQNLVLEKFKTSGTWTCAIILSFNIINALAVIV